MARKREKSSHKKIRHKGVTSPKGSIRTTGDPHRADVRQQKEKRQFGMHLILLTYFESKLFQLFVEGLLLLYSLPFVIGVYVLNKG